MSFRCADSLCRRTTIISLPLLVEKDVMNLQFPIQAKVRWKATQHAA
jgi:hypothetical protein